MQPLGEVVEADGLLVVGDGGEDAGGGVDGGIIGRSRSKMTIREGTGLYPPSSLIMPTIWSPRYSAGL